MNNLFKIIKGITVTLLFVVIIYSLINPETSLQQNIMSAYKNIVGVSIYTTKALINVIFNTLTVIAATWVAMLIPIIPFTILMMTHPKEKMLTVQYPTYFVIFMIGNTSLCGLATICFIIDSLTIENSMSAAISQTISVLKNPWLYSFGLSMFFCYLQYSPTPKTKKALKETMTKSNAH